MSRGAGWAAAVGLTLALSCAGEPGSAPAPSAAASGSAPLPLAPSPSASPSPPSASASASASATAAGLPTLQLSGTFARRKTPARAREEDEQACVAGQLKACLSMAERYRGFGAPAGCGLQRGRPAPFSKRTATDTMADDAAFLGYVARACDLGDAESCDLERAARAQSVWSAKHLELQLTRTPLARSGLARFVAATRPEWTQVLRDERASCMSDSFGCWGVEQILFRRTAKLDATKPAPELFAQVEAICADTAECDQVFMMLDKYGFDEAALAAPRAAAAKTLTQQCLDGACVCGQAARFVPEASREHLALSQLGCENGEAEGCYGLARQLESGAQLPKDSALARRLYELACPSQNPVPERDGPRRGEHSPRACDRLAELFEAGQMPPEDERSAFHYAKLACSHVGVEIDHAPCVRLARYWATTKRDTGRNGEDARLTFRKKDECRRPSVRALCERHEKEIFARP